MDTGKSSPIESSVFPWLKHIPPEDLVAFLEDVVKGARKAVSHQDIKYLDTEIAAWKSTAEAMVDPDVREVLLNPSIEDCGPVPEPKLPEPVQRHHYTYDGQKYVDGQWVNHCGECKRAQNDLVHYMSGLSVITEMNDPLDARYKSGSIIRDKKTGLEWYIQHVTDRDYLLRHAHHSPGETWQSYVWDRATVEYLTELVSEEN
jgi:hypothetical protein